MNKVYEKPWIEIEYYTLDASIAANCKDVVAIGPDNIGTGQKACDGWKNDYGEFSLYSITNSSFYNEGSICDCYYSSGGEGYFTS